MFGAGWLSKRKSHAFTLQWHLTNACGCHCLHCYDRTLRAELSLLESLRVVEGLKSFCAERRVRPHLSLSGGDPLLYPHFHELYRKLAADSISVSILGNPVEYEVLAELASLRRPVFYQVSLEGLKAHNDFIRGAGHYERVRKFLIDARSLGVPTCVMLTLTKDNMDQAIPLGEELRGLTSRFTFNRLSKTGEGASLELPSKRDYSSFLERYLQAGQENPVLGFKENLFNIHRSRLGASLFPGCAGRGCGAALTFLALLPDGEVHACRKYHSPLGNVRESSLSSIYSSREAKRYRDGSLACRGCKLRASCGGCPAVTSGAGLDPLKDKDPFCFLDEEPHRQSPL